MDARIQQLIAADRLQRDIRAATAAREARAARGAAVSARILLAAVVVACALAAPAAARAQGPDLAQLSIDRSDLPAGASVRTEGSLTLEHGPPMYYRDFALPRRSGFTRLNAAVTLFDRPRDAAETVRGMRFLMRHAPTKSALARLVASDLGVRPGRLKISRPQPLHVGDGGFTVSIRVNRKVDIVVGIFRLDRALAEIDARGAPGKAGLLNRTRAALRASANRIRHGLSPVSLTPPAIAGTPAVGAALQSTPGTWDAATRPDSFGYAWQRCDAARTCAAIAGATQSSYTVAAADVGFTLRVVVTAANAVGETTAASAPTAPIPGPPGAEEAAR